MGEKIGKVKMNLDYSGGEDLYSDGEVEEQLLKIVKSHREEEFPEIIMKEKSWPILYHLSKQRQNIIEWYPFEPEAAVFEVGAGCGAITGALTRAVKKVVANDLSNRRSMINAYRNQNAGNLEIMVGNFNVVSEHTEEKFDYVTLIGVFEYAESYMGTCSPYDDFLTKIRGLLKAEGTVIIAIENKLGLKYFAGCPEDHVGRPFEGLEGYPNTSGVKTFSKKELSELLEGNGFHEVQFYYPYPDYKLPTTIYSDSYLPKDGELVNNQRNFDTDRIVLFDETRAFDSIIKAGLFPEFSNSFLVTAQKRGEQDA